MSSLPPEPSALHSWKVFLMKLLDSFKAEASARIQWFITSFLSLPKPNVSIQGKDLLSSQRGFVYILNKNIIFSLSLEGRKGECTSSYVSSEIHNLGVFICDATSYMHRCNHLALITSLSKVRGMRTSATLLLLWITKVWHPIQSLVFLWAKEYLRSFTFWLNRKE